MVHSWGHNLSNCKKNNKNKGPAYFPSLNIYSQFPTYFKHNRDLSWTDRSEQKETLPAINE